MDEEHTFDTSDDDGPPEGDAKRATDAIRDTINEQLKATVRNLVEAATDHGGWVQTNATKLGQQPSAETYQLLTEAVQSIEGYTSVFTAAIENPEEDLEEDRGKAQNRSPRSLPGDKRKNVEAETKKGAGDKLYKFGIIRHKEEHGNVREIKYVIILKTVQEFDQIKQILNQAFGKQHGDYNTSFTFPP